MCVLPCVASNFEGSYGGCCCFVMTPRAREYTGGAVEAESPLLYFTLGSCFASNTIPHSGSFVPVFQPKVFSRSVLIPLMFLWLLVVYGSHYRVLNPRVVKIEMTNTTPPPSKPLCFWLLCFFETHSSTPTAAWGWRRLGRISPRTSSSLPRYVRIAESRSHTSSFFTVFHLSACKRHDHFAAQTCVSYNR